MAEEYDFWGDENEDDFLEELLCCDEEYTLDDFFDSYDPEM